MSQSLLFAFLLTLPLVAASFYLHTLEIGTPSNEYSSYVKSLNLIHIIAFLPTAPLVLTVIPFGGYLVFFSYKLSPIFTAVSWTVVFYLIIRLMRRISLGRKYTYLAALIIEIIILVPIINYFADKLP
jgi:hypothetical protein